jgi:glycine cleavage system H protein
MSAEGKRLYAETHEWVRVESKKAFVGISDHAQHELGDIVFVELPKVGTKVRKGGEAANIESVKAASPIYAPVSGVIVEVNPGLDAEPELVNKKPYEAFLFVIELSDTGELDSLMDEDAYAAYLKEKS